MTAIDQYAAPKSNLATDGENTASVKVFAARGRLGRLRYLAYTFGLTLLALLLIGILSGLTAVGGVFGAVVGGILIMAVYGLMLTMTVLLTVRRCHDFNASGWLALLLILPLVPIIFWFIPGTDGANNYGPKPPPNSTLVVIGGLLIPVMFFLGLLSAITIPAYQNYVQQAQQAEQNR